MVTTIPANRSQFTQETAEPCKFSPAELVVYGRELDPWLFQLRDGIAIPFLFRQEVEPYVLVRPSHSPRKLALVSTPHFEELTPPFRCRVRATSLQQIYCIRSLDSWHAAGVLAHNLPVGHEQHNSLPATGPLRNRTCFAHIQPVGHEQHNILPRTVPVMLAVDHRTKGRD